MWTCYLFNSVLAGNRVPHLTFVAREGVHTSVGCLHKIREDAVLSPKRGVPARVTGWLPGLRSSSPPKSEKIHLSIMTMYFTAVCCRGCHRRVPAQPHRVRRPWPAHAVPGGGVKEQMTPPKSPPTAGSCAGALRVTPARRPAGPGEQPRAQTVPDTPTQPRPHPWACTLHVTVFSAAGPRVRQPVRALSA